MDSWVWATMASMCIMQADLRLQGGLWNILFLDDKWLTKLLVRGLIGQLLKKCKKVASTLKWEENERHFGYSNLHWSP